jgi:hypothetical protein
MTSNRKARQTLAWGKSPHEYRISNRRVMVHSANWPFMWTFETKKSRSQKRTARLINSIRSGES